MAGGKEGPKAEWFRQTKPCSDCPFLKTGGVQHGRLAVLRYASYFTENPAHTFPCHESRPADCDNSRWEEWRDGQTICAGGLIFAENIRRPNAFLQAVKELGWYTVGKLRGRHTVCGSFDELMKSQPAFPDDGKNPSGE